MAASPRVPPVDEYHAASSLEELTAQNVKSVAEIERAARKPRSRGDRIAGFITRFCGSMAFVWVHIAWFSLWTIGNTMLPKAIDPYPFNFLTMVVSLEAIFLSTFIMISENRQEKIDERRSHLDLQVNLLAEQENTKMLHLLNAIALKMGIDPNTDPTIAVLEQATRPEKLIEQIDESVKQAEKE
jgi:uncharacterized membrane protein